MLEHTFREAIRSGDIAARFIYADWLEEQGRVVECGILRSGRWCLFPADIFWIGGGGGEPGKRVKIPKPFYLGGIAFVRQLG